MKQYFKYPIFIAIATVVIEFITNLITTLALDYTMNTLVLAMILGYSFGAQFVNVTKRVMTMSEKLQTVGLYLLISSSISISAGALSDLGEISDSSAFWVFVAGAVIIFSAAHYAALTFGCKAGMKSVEKAALTEVPKAEQEEQ